MEELLEKINQTFDNVINASNEDTALQLRIVKGNINTLFKEAMNSGVTTQTVNTQPAVQPVVEPVIPVVQSVPTVQPVIEVEAPVVQPEPIVQQPQVSEVSETVVDDKKNVLICDDSSIIRNYLQKAINGKYNTTLVTGGQDAINTIPNGKYDLILLDIMMPGIDGFGVLEFLKNSANTTPVIIISGDTTKESIDRAFTYNVVDMIEKPFSEKVIMDKISRVLD